MSSRRSVLIGMGGFGVGSVGWAAVRPIVLGESPEAVVQGERTVAARGYAFVDVERRTDAARLQLDVEQGAVDGWLSVPADGDGRQSFAAIGGDGVAVGAGESGAVEYGDVPEGDLSLVLRSESEIESVVTFRLEWR